MEDNKRLKLWNICLISEYFLLIINVTRWIFLIWACRRKLPTKSMAIRKSLLEGCCEAFASLWGIWLVFVVKHDARRSWAGNWLVNSRLKDRHTTTDIYNSNMGWCLHWTASVMVALQLLKCLAFLFFGVKTKLKQHWTVYLMTLHIP